MVLLPRHHSYEPASAAVDGPRSRTSTRCRTSSSPSLRSGPSSAQSTKVTARAAQQTGTGMRCLTSSPAVFQRTNASPQHLERVRSASSSERAFRCRGVRPPPSWGALATTCVARSVQQERVRRDESPSPRPPWDAPHEAGLNDDSVSAGSLQPMPVCSAASGASSHHSSARPTISLKRKVCDDSKDARHWGNAVDAARHDDQRWASPRGTSSISTTEPLQHRPSAAAHSSSSPSSSSSLWRHSSEDEPRTRPPSSSLEGQNDNHAVAVEPSASSFTAAPVTFSATCDVIPDPNAAKWVASCEELSSCSGRTAVPPFLGQLPSSSPFSALPFLFTGTMRNARACTPWRRPFELDPVAGRRTSRDDPASIHCTTTTTRMEVTLSRSVAERALESVADVFALSASQARWRLLLECVGSVECLLRQRFALAEDDERSQILRAAISDAQRCLRCTRVEHVPGVEGFASSHPQRSPRSSDNTERMDSKRRSRSPQTKSTVLLSPSPRTLRQRCATGAPPAWETLPLLGRENGQTLRNARGSERQRCNSVSSPPRVLKELTFQSGRFSRATAAVRGEVPSALPGDESKHRVPTSGVPHCSTRGDGWSVVVPSPCIILRRPQSSPPLRAATRVFKALGDPLPCHVASQQHLQRQNSEAPIAPNRSARGEVAPHCKTVASATEVLKRTYEALHDVQQARSASDANFLRPRSLQTSTAFALDDGNVSASSLSDDGVVEDDDDDDGMAPHSLSPVPLPRDPRRAPLEHAQQHRNQRAPVDAHVGNPLQTVFSSTGSAPSRVVDPPCSNPLPSMRRTVALPVSSPPPHGTTTSKGVAVNVGGAPTTTSAVSCTTGGGVTPYIELLKKASQELHELRKQRDELTKLVERLGDVRRPLVF